MKNFYAAFAALAISFGIFVSGVGYAAAQDRAVIAPGAETAEMPASTDDDEEVGEIKDSDRCTVENSVYVDAIGTCVFRMTDPKEVRKFSPDRGDDPRCVGKPAGYRYDEAVTDPAHPGRKGIAHRVCGQRRPS